MFGTLQAVRNQLPTAVQTENQFVAVYMAQMIYALQLDPNYEVEDFEAFRSEARNDDVDRGLPSFQVTAAALISNCQ